MGVWTTFPIFDWVNTLNLYNPDRLHSIRIKTKRLEVLVLYLSKLGLMMREVKQGDTVFQCHIHLIPRGWSKRGEYQINVFTNLDEWKKKHRSLSEMKLEQMTKWRKYDWIIKRSATRTNEVVVKGIQISWVSLLIVYMKFNRKNHFIAKKRSGLRIIWLNGNLKIQAIRP